MSLDSGLAEHGTILAIVAMWAVTYLWRAGGFYLMGFVKPHPRITRAFAALPGSVAVATVLPLAWQTGWVAAAALAVALPLVALTRNEFIGVGCGLPVAILARSVGL